MATVRAEGILFPHLLQAVKRKLPFATTIMKVIFTIFFISLCSTSFAQEDLNNYLRMHNYPFSIDKGFDKTTSDTLKLKFSNYKVIIQAELSHTLIIYKKIRLMWIEFLNKNLGLTHFFMEYGADATFLGDKYLETGDTSNLAKGWINFWRPYYQLNSDLPIGKKITPIGIDFNRPLTYLSALKLLLPNVPPPENIKSNIELIKNAFDSTYNCDYILTINTKLKDGLSKYKSDYIQYFGKSYKYFERIVNNKGTCNDVRKNRNYNMVENFLTLDNEINDSLYYGELGMAHTILKNKVFASLLNNSPKFENKVCVINLYCYNCSSKTGEISNKIFGNIESDIQKYFLPLCTSDFTLFDLSENLALTKKYREYGQFLIIAKDQN